MNIIFMGTPEFALAALQKIHDSQHKILAVISQPDRVLDKKGQLVCTPVKQLAQSLGLKVYQFDKVSVEGIQLLRQLCPDAIVTSAFGQILSEELLNIPKHGVFNIHGSVLPRLRGASPIQTAILEGENETGITIMRTVYKMDAGDIIKTAKVAIDETTTFGQLSSTLSQLGAELILSTLDEVQNGTAVFIPQDERQATYTKKLTKQDARIDFESDAKSIVRKINAFSPSPSAYAFYNGDNIKFHEGRAVEYEGCEPAGAVLECSNELIIKCKAGAVSVLQLQAPGRKRLKCAEFLRGYRVSAGGRFE